jgi:fructosamine-3-kinase
MRGALAVAADITGVAATSAHPLGGAVYWVQLLNGDAVAVKRHDRPNAAPAEAASLAWLAEPGVVPVPKVLGHEEHWLVTEVIDPGSPSPEAAEELGRGLAKLHGAGAPGFGSAPPDGPEEAAIGLAPMRNEQFQRWPEFYAALRIEPYVRDAVDRGTFGSVEQQILGEVIDNIDSLAGPAEPPSRLHGDLWSGNVHWGADGRAWLIDPAAHGGHRETDLAMLQLFGCPHLELLLEAYNDEAPLSDGWRQRVALHQLFPLLVHAVLFGGGYSSQAVAAARAALRA